MRIIAGQWRSRRLVRPRTELTRPMPDRVKEAVFSILGARYATPDALPPLRVADVFAGSGAMGLEALSRGAASCGFFERGRVALVALRRNVEELEAGDRATVVPRDAWRHAVSDGDGEAFDLVFLDPPYRDSDDTTADGPVQSYLARLAENASGRPLVVLHHRTKARHTPATDLWQIVDHREYGTSAVTFFKR